MRSAARALALLLLLGCGQYPSARQQLGAPAGPEAAAAAPPGSPAPTGANGSTPGRRDHHRTQKASAPRRAVPAATSPGAGPSHGGTVRVVPSAPRLAVVVGIDDYPGDRDLRAAQADARTVALSLERLGFPDAHTRVLLGHDATADRLVSSLGWLARNTGPRAVGVFFFAGHIRKVAGDPDGDGEELDEALVAADGSVVTDGAVAAALASARGRLWLAYAGCYAAGFADAAGPGRISTYASGEDALAYESSALGHSFMVEYMIRRAMPDAGTVTVEGLYRWAVRHMDGRMRRFRPLQHDGLSRDLVLGELPPQAVPRPSPREHDRPCLVVLRCEA